MPAFSILEYSLCVLATVHSLVDALSSGSNGDTHEHLCIREPNTGDLEAGRRSIAPGKVAATPLVEAL